MSIFSRCTAGALLPIAALLLASCAPLIETTMDTAPLPLDAGAQARPGAIVIVTSGLERTPDLIDPLKLKTAMEGLMHTSGVFSAAKVILSDVPGQVPVPRMEIVLSRLEYTMHGLRMPPAPPCGLALLYPFIAPMLLTRDYLQHEVVAEGDLLVYDSEGVVRSRLFLFEFARGRTNLFNAGGSKAAVRLTEIALHNFSRRALIEFLYLTREETVAKFL